MRLLYAVLLLASLTGRVQAQQHVYETALGEGSVTNFLVTTSTVNVDSSTRTLSTRFTMELYNDDSANPAWCAFTLNVSTIPGNANYGRKIPAGTAWVLAVPDALKVWCRSAVAAGVRLVLTQLR